MKKILFSLLAISLLALNACRQDNNPVAAPIIVDFGVNVLDTAITPQSSIDFAPQLNSTEGTEYSWRVDGKIVASTPTFKFTSETTGRFLITFFAKNSSGVAAHELMVTVKKYVGGYMMVNEGWFGHTLGSVNYYDALNKTLLPDAQAPAELGKTTCYGALWNGIYYFISKQGTRLVAFDALSFAKKGELAEIGGDGRAFAGIDAQRGVVTTTDGAYLVTLGTLALGAKLEGSDGQCGAVYVADNNIFIVNQDKGILVYAVANKQVIATHQTGAVGFAHAKDGSLWAAQGSILVKIDTRAATFTDVALPEGVVINDSWGSWNAGSLCASATENVLYFAKIGAWGGGNEIYRYVIGEQNAAMQPFMKSTKADDSFYGSGISVDPKTGDVVAIFTHDGWNDYDDNRLVTFDAKTGAEKTRFEYKGFYFPAMILFN